MNQIQFGKSIIKYSIIKTKRVKTSQIVVDRDNDYKLVKLLADKINKSPILISDIVNLLEKEPELKKINEHIDFNEGQSKSIKEENN